MDESPRERTDGMSKKTHEQSRYSAAAMPRGIVPVIDTPFDDKGEINY